MTLGAGRYVIGALYEIGDTDTVVFQASSIFSNDAAAAYTNLAYINSGALDFPSNTASLDDRYFGPTLLLAEGSVPEPGTLSLLGMGIVGFFFAGRTKKIA